MRIRHNILQGAAGLGAAMMLSVGTAGAVPNVGTRAHNLVLPKVTGGTFRLSSVEGRQPVLLNFFTTW